MLKDISVTIKKIWFRSFLLICYFRYWISNLEFQILKLEFWIENLEWSFRVFVLKAVIKSEFTLKTHDTCTLCYF